MIDYDFKDGIGTITLNRPERLNALTLDSARALLEALDAADKDPDVRAVIVTGTGKAFCAGADLAEGPTATEDVVERDFGGLITLRLFDMNKPVIAAVNGPAVGVGATMQLPMDVRIAAHEAQFGFVFTRRGLVPEAASSWFLPRIVGISTALQWCLSGSMISSEDAQRAGLVSCVQPREELLNVARTVARSFMDGAAPVSVAMTRRMLWTMLGASHPMEAHILDSHALAERVASSDFSEGVEAFLQKRVPQFPDRLTDNLSTLFGHWSPRPFS